MLIVSDVIVIAITWIKTHGLVKDAFDLNLRSTISTVLLADGTQTFEPAPNHH